MAIKRGMMKIVVADSCKLERTDTSSLILLEASPLDVLRRNDQQVGLDLQVGPCRLGIVRSNEFQTSPPRTQKWKTTGVVETEVKGYVEIMDYIFLVVLCSMLDVVLFGNGIWFLIAVCNDGYGVEMEYVILLGLVLQ
ncbi:unnamed protein product [Vicia faba]|uniref:Uncharacterized protein n=1 Tax=Vicia faba TaxID=3906 RepID=A0AAV1ANU3_VICFA|nr:unnamed protein product [Vicia faba]